MDEFKGHFRMTKKTCEALVREIVATGNIPVGNRFENLLTQRSR